MQLLIDRLAFYVVCLVRTAYPYLFSPLPET